MVARLVHGWTGCRWRSSWPPPGSRRSASASCSDRLDDRFRLLVSANRGAAARQRSLEAAVDWSYQLLSASEQRVFRRLSVFPGPFTLDAAEAMAGADAGPAVLRLVDCSLLVPPRTGPDGRSRYSMLETLRGYGVGGSAGRRGACGGRGAGRPRAARGRTAPPPRWRRDREQSAALWLDAEDAAVHQGLAWALDHDPPARSAGRGAGAVVAGARPLGPGIRAAAACGRPGGPGRSAWCSAQSGWASSRTARPISTARPGPLQRGGGALRDGPPSADLVDGLSGRCAALRNMGRLAEAAADARTALELARQIGYADGRGTRH